MSNPSEILREALNYAADCAATELVEAQNLYSHYPRDGLGRKLTAAEETVAMIDSARRALAVAQPSLEPSGKWTGSIPGEESDEEFARQIEEMNHPTEHSETAVQRPAGEDIAELLAWVGQAVEYVNSKAMDPTLERVGRALLYRVGSRQGGRGE